MNWGWKIFLVYSIFVTFMLFMVYECTQQNIDLVSEDYYAKELKFQDHFTRLQNVESSGLRLAFDMNPQIKLLAIGIPAAALNDSLNGEISFFRPDNKQMDFSLPLLAHSGKQLISCKKLSRGLWKVQVNWNSGNQGYYEEKQFFIP